MKKLRLLGTFCASVLLINTTQIMAAAINQVDYFSLSGNGLIDFDDVASAPPVTNINGILDLDGAKFGERFFGQTLSTSFTSDVLSGTPLPGILFLEAGIDTQNLAILEEFDYKVLVGLGISIDLTSAVGEGAVSIMFDFDQSEFGFRSVGGDAGSAVIEFWRRDGSLIDTITPMNLGVDYFGFSRENSIQDVAGISIWNTDVNGIGYDDIIFDVPASGPVVPLPAAVWLFGSGLLGLFGVAKRKKA